MVRVCQAMETQFMLAALMLMPYEVCTAFYHWFGIIILIFKQHPKILYGKAGAVPNTKIQLVKQQRKPKWVKNEIIRLKAFMIHDGCRKTEFWAPSTRTAHLVSYIPIILPLSSSSHALRPDLLPHIKVTIPSTR